MKKIKISELPLYDGSLNGLQTIATDAGNQSVRVPLSGLFDSSAQATANSAAATAAEARAAADAAASGVDALSGKLGAASGIATLDADGKLAAAQVPGNIATLSDGKLAAAQLPDNVATLDADGRLPADRLPATAATLGEDGRVPASQLPASLDDVVEFAGDASALAPESGKLYVDTTTGRLYRYDGTALAEVCAQPTVAEPTGEGNAVTAIALLDGAITPTLGETFATAGGLAPRLFFDVQTLLGDKAQTAYTLADARALVKASAPAAMLSGAVLTFPAADGAWEAWQWSGSPDADADWADDSRWRKFGGSATVGNTYNVTVDAPLAVGYYDLPTAIAAAYERKYNIIGIQITFAIAKGSWKTYQYVGQSTDETEFCAVANWIDLAGMSAGSEPVVNVNGLCGDVDYTLSSAVAAIIALEASSGIAYRKEGLVITYRRSSEPLVWETKQYVGRVLDMTAANEAQWHDFGGGSDVTATDQITADSAEAVTSGAVYDALRAQPIVNFDDNSDADNYVFQGVNANGENVGDPITIPRAGAGAGQTGSTLNIYPETQAVWGAFGASITLRAAIKSVSFDGDTEIRGTIRTVAILDASTGIELWASTVNTASSASATDYKFTFDFTPYITAASSRDFTIRATDADGNAKSRTVTVTAVDVTVTCVATLNYTSATALAAGGPVKSLPLYKFPNNVSTKQGIRAVTEMYYGGAWRKLGEAVVTDTYTHNVSIDPQDAFGGGEQLAHGSYPLRVQGVDVASGVAGNTVYCAVMCIDPDSTVPVVSLRYDDSTGGKVRLYDTLAMDVAAYTPGKTATAVDVVIDGATATTVNCAVGQTYNVARQVQGYPSDGSKSIAFYAQSGAARTATLTVTVEGSAIDAELKEGAEIAYDFSTRSNSEADHTITSNGHEMAVSGANWNSNGFVSVLGEQALRIAENVTAEIPYAPFSSAALEASGMALQFAFSTRSVKDPAAKLMECHDPAAGAGFYVTGNEVVLAVRGGTPSVQRVKFRSGEKITVAVVVEPGAKTVTYNGATDYSFVKLYVNGEMCAAIGYQPGTSALRQSRTITFDSTSGDIALNYLLAYTSHMEWLQAFDNYLCKLSDVAAMVAEYDANQVLDATGKPSMSLMAAAGIPYYVVVADQQTFDNFDYALNGGTSTSDKFSCTLYYRNPSHPELDFKAANVLWRRQGTTSAQRPIKNDRFNLNKKSPTGMPSVTLLNPDDTTELGRNAILAARHNKVFVDPDGFAVDIITVKVDYSDSSNANDCGVCDMMNATFRALGGKYMTPAQRAFDGTQDLGDGDVLTGRVLDHSTKNHPIACFRATSETLQDAWFHAKGNWKEDKGEQTALGFKDTPGYNKGCLNYGDFIEYFGTEGETLAQTEARFKADATADTSAVYLISQYCGRDYAIYRHSGGAWTRSTGSMKQVNGKWVVTGDVLNPVTGYELLQYAGMDWWQGVASVADMMAPSAQKSSWVNKLGLAATTYPAWTYYFECMVDDDQLQQDLALGKKVPYDLYALLRFFDSCDYTKVEGWQDVWKQNAYKYLSPESAMAYTGFTDYLAAVDQRAKNMQPMFFLEDGCSVENGAYTGADGMEPVRMYLNKVYDCDTCNGADNDGGRDIDPEVDPNKATDTESGYTNPYMGSGSVLFNDMDKQQELWNAPDGSATISLKSVVNRMRNQTAEVGDRTMAPFSPDGAMYYFVEKRLKFWPKVVSSYDGQRKYIDCTHYANLPYFYALHGLGLTALPRFIEQRWAIRDGYYQTGDFFTNPLSGRVSALSGASRIYITAAATGYFGIGNDASGQLSETVYLEKGATHAFTSFAHDAGALLYIYQPGRMSAIDLSEMSLAFHFDDLSKLSLCEALTLGGAKHTAEASLNGFAALGSIVLGDMPFLRTLDVSGTTATSIDAKGCPRMESIDASSTPLTSCALAQTAPIASLTLPATITALELVNLPRLAYTGGDADGLAVAGFSALTRLWVEGCPRIDATRLLTAAAAGGRLKQVRAANLDTTAAPAPLRTLRTVGAVGLDASGTAYEESGKCSGLTGKWVLSQYIDTADTADDGAGLDSLKAYFPELALYNSQYTEIVFDDAVSDAANITNMENGTSGDTYAPSGHVARYRSLMHPYKGKLNATTGKWVGVRISDANYQQLLDGSSFDYADNYGEGFDAMMHFPHLWLKGVNDYKNQRKHAFFSTEDAEPLSTATRVTRRTLSDILRNGDTALSTEYATVGGTLADDGVLITTAGYNVYSLDVSGMRQVRWPAVASSTIGAAFLDAEGKILSTFNFAVASTDFMAGDYVFCPVPDGAATFAFASPSSNDPLEAIAVDSSEVEAVEPDWVDVAPFLLAIYEASVDGLTQLRSVSGATTRTGNNTSATSTEWTYDAAGRATNTPVGTINYTCKDFMNLAMRRGPGYQLVDYEMHKLAALLWYALNGTRDAQYVCGYGRSAGGATGSQDALGNRDSARATASNGNKCLGLENFFGCTWEWMDNVLVNAASWQSYLKNQCAEVSTDPVDGVWHVYDPTSGAERTVKGLTGGSGYCIARTRHGRHCDIIPSKVSSDNSKWASDYCDRWEYSHSRCRVVGRASSHASANGGLACAYAYGVASGSSAGGGSRLAFRGELELSDAAS